MVERERVLIVDDNNGRRYRSTTHHTGKGFSGELFGKRGVKGRTGRRERGGRIKGKGTTTKKRGQHIYVRGATGGDTEVEWGGGEADMGRGMPISGCYGLQRGPRGKPDAIV